MIRSRISIFAALGAATCLAVAFAASPAPAQGIERVGDFGDWSSFKFVEDGKPGCYMASQPKKAKGDYKKRGDIYAIVAHRPAESRRDEVSIVAGYSFEKDSWAEVIIGKQSYKLFTEDDGAWAPDKDADKALVTAMKKGTTMVVKGTSLRGTATTDTYSLKGFTKAYNAISKACKAK